MQCPRCKSTKIDVDYLRSGPDSIYKDSEHYHCQSCEWNWLETLVSDSFNQQSRISEKPMIQGLKVTVSTEELKELCCNRAKYHCDRALAYLLQIQSMEANQLEGIAYTNGNPIQALRDRKDKHGNDADELQFIADHLVPNAQYLLEHEDLVKLGIIKSRY